MFRAQTVEFGANVGESVAWSITRGTPGTVLLRSFYYTVTQNVSLELVVNGGVVRSSWDFPTYNQPQFILKSNEAVEISLIAGVNTIELRSAGLEADIRLDFIAFGGDGAMHKLMEPSPSSSELHNVQILLVNMTSLVDYMFCRHFVLLIP